MLGLLTQLEGNIQSGHKNPDIPEYAGEAGLCKCQTLCSITPTTIPQTSQFAGHLATLQTLLTATTTKPLQGDAPPGSTPGHKL